MRFLTSVPIAGNSSFRNAVECQARMRIQMQIHKQFRMQLQLQSQCSACVAIKHL